LIILIFSEEYKEVGKGFVDLSQKQWEKYLVGSFVLKPKIMYASQQGD
jgi:hypothetical protein